MADTLQIEIVTPERMIINDRAVELAMPGKGGYLGIFPGHAPLITELSVGQIAYRNEAGTVSRFAVAWGFAEVLPDKVTIMAEAAERSEEIDVAKAKQEKEAAEKLLAQAPAEEHSAALDSLKRANTWIEVAARANGEMGNLLP